MERTELVVRLDGAAWPSGLQLNKCLDRQPQWLLPRTSRHGDDQHISFTAGSRSEPDNRRLLMEKP